MADKKELRLEINCHEINKGVSEAFKQIDVRNHTHPSETNYVALHLGMVEYQLRATNVSINELSPQALFRITDTTGREIFSGTLAVASTKYWGGDSFAPRNLAPIIDAIKADPKNLEEEFLISAEKVAKAHNFGFDRHGSNGIGLTTKTGHKPRRYNCQVSRVSDGLNLIMNMGWYSSGKDGLWSKVYNSGESVVEELITAAEAHSAKLDANIDRRKAKRRADRLETLTADDMLEEFLEENEVDFKRGSDRYDGEIQRFFRVRGPYNTICVYIADQKLRCTMHSRPTLYNIVVGVLANPDHSPFEDLLKVINHFTSGAEDIIRSVKKE